jgi:hypothetical protein
MKNIFKSFAEILGSEPKIIVENDEQVAEQVAEQASEQASEQVAEDIKINEDAAESPNEAAGYVMLAENQVVINADELAALKEDAKQYQAISTEYANLKAWKKEADNNAGLGGGEDAADSAEPVKKKSYLQEIADKRAKSRK